MRRALIVVGLMLVAVAPGAPAVAGTYEVEACSATAPGAGAWQGSSSHAGLEVVVACPPEGRRVTGLIAQERPGALSVPPGSRTEWVFNAPPGSRITGFRALRLGVATGDDGWQTYLRDGTGRDLELCFPQPGTLQCFLAVQGGRESGDIEYTGLDTNQLAFGVRCQVPAGQIGRNCITSFDFRSSYSAGNIAVQLTDPAPPQVTDTNGALRQAEGRWVRGAVTLDVSGTDDLSGVAGVGVLAHGQPAAFTPATCDPGQITRCPPRYTGTVTVDTRQIPDGLTTIHGYAQDASGERAISPSWLVGIDNNPADRLGVAADRAPVQGGRPFRLQIGLENGAPITHIQWRFEPRTPGLRRVSGSAGGSHLTRTSPTDPRLVTPPIGLPAGDYFLRVILTDAAGNVTPLSSRGTFLVERAPGTAGAPGTLRVIRRGTRRVALVTVTRSARTHRYRVTVTQPGRPPRRLSRVVPAGGRILSVPLGPIGRRRVSATVTYRLVGAPASRAIRLRVPAPLPTKKR